MLTQVKFKKGRSMEKRTILNFKTIWDKFTDKYSSLPLHPQYFLKKYNYAAIKFALNYAKGILLDIGCGRMPYKRALLPYIKKYIGLDSPETSKMYHGKDRPDIFADATKIPLPKASCDTILLLQVLEHLPEPQRAIEEIVRVLKPNGVLILSTIQSYPTHDEPYDFYRYTKYGIKHLLEKGGLKIIKHKGEGNVFTLSFQSFNVYLMLILKSLTKQKNGKLIAAFLAPVFLCITTVSNLITLPFLLLDKKSKFRIIHTVVAKRK